MLRTVYFNELSKYCDTWNIFIYPLINILFHSTVFLCCYLSSYLTCLPYVLPRQNFVLFGRLETYPENSWRKKKKSHIYWLINMKNMTFQGHDGACVLHLLKGVPTWQTFTKLWKRWMEILRSLQTCYWQSWQALKVKGVVLSIIVLVAKNSKSDQTESLQSICEEFITIQLLNALTFSPDTHLNTNL